MKELTPQVNVAEEEKAIVEHLNFTWGPYEHWPALVSCLSQRGLELGQHWFDEYSLFMVSHDLAEARRGMLESRGTPDFEVYYDAPYHVMSQLGYLNRTAHDAVMQDWYFERVAKRAATAARAVCPGLSELRPLGWNNPAEGPAMSIQQLRDRFQGSNTASVAAGDFVERVALGHVKYESEDQGMAPVNTLCGAVLAHFLTIAKLLNNQAIVEDLRRFSAALPADFTRECVAQFQHPMLQLMAKHARPVPTDQELEESRQARRDFMALSKEEQEAQTKANEENMLQSLRQRDPEMEAFLLQSKAREEALTVEIRSVLFAKAAQAQASA